MLHAMRLTLVAASLGVLLIPDCALAQNDNNSVETIVVTGTRIPRPESEMANPVTSVSSVEIEHSGTINLTDYLKRIPALTGSLNDFQTSGYNTPASDDGSSLGGLNLLDLRNLGYVRTLVLIDGHRTVGQATGSTAVDIDSIPITMIDRIEVVTGGSSAVYGADGVSGVVNFVMKHNLEGVTAKVQAGTSQDGGGSKYLAAASVGRDIDNGNGNIALTFEDSYQDRLNYTQRSFTRGGGYTAFVPNPANPDGTKPNIPANIPTNNAQFVFSAPTGAIDTDLDGLPDFLGNGQHFKLGTDVGGGSAIGSSGQPYANDLEGDFLPIEHRRIAQFEGDEQFSHWFKVSTELKYAHVDTKSYNIAPFDDDIMVTAQNAFLPANVATAIANNGLGEGALSEDYLDMRESERVARDTYRGVLDVSGALPLPEFMHDAKYDVSYVYGKTDINDVDENNRNIDRFAAALDSVIDPATGQPTCRSNLDPSAIPPPLRPYYGPGNNYFSDTQEWFPREFGTTFTPGPNSGCVPYNPFNPNFNNKASIAWMTQDTDVKGYLSQQVVNGFVSFDFPQVQDWGFAKPVSFVFGGEYRVETSKSTPEAITEIPQLYWIGGTLPVQGSFNVAEAVGETSIPVLADKPFVKELTFDFAGRLSSYSTAGDNQSWKMDAVYSPFSGIKLRGTDAVAVRAPNIGELFAPNQQLFAFVDDPCDAHFIKQGTSFRAANCQALENALLGPGAYKAGVSDVQTDQTTPNLIGGNENLRPETARTQTLGIVIQPDFLSDFVATADWYRVNISDAIEAPDAQQVANECVDLSTIVNPYCGEVQRTASGNFPGSIKEITTRQINVASFFTQGIDLSVSYHANLDDWFSSHLGSVDLHLIGNHLDTISTTPLPGQAPIQSANTFDGGVDAQPTPYWQMNLDTVWNYDAWSVDYNVDWYDGILNFERQAIHSEPNIAAAQFIHQPPHDVHSIQVGYDIREGWNVYAGINNLWYQKPSIGNNGLPVDPLGRFFYGGVKVDFNPF